MSVERRRGRGSWRAVLLRIALVLGALVAVGVMCEVVLRLFSPYPYYGYVYIPPHRGLFQYDPLLGWTGRPLASGRFANLDFAVEVHHDRHGYRNANPIHVADRTNVLILGDSYGWGWGVEDDEVVSNQLMLMRPELNVYNLSAPGYGTDQELLTLERVLEERADDRFDAVVLLLSYTDFIDVAHDVRYSYPKPRFERGWGELRLTNVPVPTVKAAEYDRANRDYERLERGVMTRFHLFNLLHFEGRRLAENLRAASGAEAVGDAVDRRPDAALTALLVQRIAGVCTDRGIDLHVVLLQTSKSDPHDRSWLTLELRLDEVGIDYTHFRRRRFPSTELWYDRHFSSFGHRLLARHILRVL